MNPGHEDCPRPFHFTGARWVCKNHHPPKPVQVNREQYDEGTDLLGKLRRGAAPRGKALAQSMGRTLGDTVSNLQARVRELEAEAVELRAELQTERDASAAAGLAVLKGSKGKGKGKGKG